MLVFPVNCKKRTVVHISSFDPLHHKCMSHDVQYLFFSFVATGEIFELKAELNSDKKEKKKEAVKKVIASMTVGKDVR